MAIQCSDNFGYVLRNGCLEYDFFAADRMDETQISGVQHLTGYPNPVVGGHFEYTGRPTRPIHRITDHRMAQGV